jgi:uncharacterized protein YchJ
MNTTTYTDGSTKVTFHENFNYALEEARRDWTNPNVRSTEQRPVDVYAPCPCGSGNKFKFCCRSKVQEGPRFPVTITP